MNVPAMSPYTLDEVKFCRNLRVVPDTARFYRREDEILLHECKMFGEHGWISELTIRHETKQRLPKIPM